MTFSSAYLFARQITAGEVPILPPDYWINDAGVDHFHDLKTPTSSNSRPCIDDSHSSYFQLYTRISGVSSDADCGVTGAKEIPMFLEDNVLQIPLYKNGVLSDYNVKFRYRPSETSQGYWRPEVCFDICNGDDAIIQHSMARNFYIENVKKVYVYAGVNTVSFWNDTYKRMSPIFPFLFCGIAVAENYFGDTDIQHIGGGYLISKIEGATTQYSKISSDWYTRS